MAKRKAQQTKKAPPQRMMEGLYDVDALVKQERFLEAHAKLEDLEKRYRGETQVYARLADVSQELGDFAAYQRACEQLSKLEPDVADFKKALSRAYLENNKLALALLTLREFLDRWPEDPFSNEAKEASAVLEDGLANMLGDYGFTLEDGFEAALQHEQIQSLVESLKTRQAIGQAEELLQKHPKFIPAYQTLSLLYWSQGRLDKAIATAEGVLAQDSGYHAALANLVRFERIRGRVDNARKYLDALKSLEIGTGEQWSMLAKSLTLLEEHQQVLDLYQKLKPDLSEEPALEYAIAYHLTAAAAMRLGDDKKAKKLWKKALEIQPGMPYAQANLQDLDQPASDRNAPWPFALQVWIPEDILNEFLGIIQKEQRRKNAAALNRAINTYLNRHPYIAGLVPLLLRLGDEAGRMFALGLARAAKTPALVAALKDFAFGMDGADRIRLEAAQALSQMGELPSGEHTMWLGGRFQSVIMLAFDIHSDHTGSLRRDVETLMQEAIAALRQGNGKKSEEILHRAIELQPDAPELHNNLAVAYELQGRQEEAVTLIKDLHTRFPDYVFGRTGVAQILVREGDIEGARASLMPVMAKKRLHVNEFDALCSAQIELFLAEKNKSAARSWFKIWESTNPENPILDNYRFRVMDLGGVIEDLT